MIYSEQQPHKASTTRTQFYTETEAQRCYVIFPKSHNGDRLEPDLNAALRDPWVQAPIPAGCFSEANAGGKTAGGGHRERTLLKTHVSERLTKRTRCTSRRKEEKGGSRAKVQDSPWVWKALLVWKPKGRTCDGPVYIYGNRNGGNAPSQGDSTIISQRGCFPKTPRMTWGKLPTGGWMTESSKWTWNPPVAPERGWDSWGLDLRTESPDQQHCGGPGVFTPHWKKRSLPGTLPHLGQHYVDSQDAYEPLPWQGTWECDCRSKLR